jgi:hypothetical protein
LIITVARAFALFGRNGELGMKKSQNAKGLSNSFPHNYLIWDFRAVLPSPKA